jgi:hypothetical protein
MTTDFETAPTFAPNVRLLAIRTGRTYTCVTIDIDANQCAVETAPAVRKRYRDACCRIVVEGTGEYSIRRVARDAAGRSYRTLKALIADQDERFEVERATEYDS